MSNSLKSRLEAAIAEALAKKPVIETPPLVKAIEAGDLFVFETGQDLSLLWLFLREHPDDPNTVCLAPIDDVEWLGTGDYLIPEEQVGRIMVARCGETGWFPKTFLVPRLRVGQLPPEALKGVRNHVAQLVRGTLLPLADSSMNKDGEYLELVEDIATARQTLLFRAENERPQPVANATRVKLAGLTTNPSFAGSAIEHSLAADSTSELMTDEVEEELRYYQVPQIGTGLLSFEIDQIGAKGIWQGTLQGVSGISGIDLFGKPMPAEWESSPDETIHQTMNRFPWIDGQIILTIHQTPTQQIVIEL